MSQLSLLRNLILIISQKYNQRYYKTSEIEILNWYKIISQPNRKAGADNLLTKPNKLIRKELCNINLYKIMQLWINIMLCEARAIVDHDIFT